MADLFLSYKSEDRARVAPLVAALQADGLSVWWDAAIEGGTGWRQAIERELNAARCVLVVWSKRSVGPEGEFVHDEATRAKRRGAYLPVTIDAVSPPLGFGETQALPLIGWKGDRADPRYRAALAAAQGMVGGTAAAPPPAPAPSRRALIGGAAGVAVLAAGGFGAWKFMGQKADDGTASIVVLPFANLSGDPGQAFFADGIAEELRNALSQIRGLKVIGRVSSEAFRDTDDLSAMAAKLGVANVLTGSVRQSPATIRIAAQLVDGKTGVESWSRSYDQPAGDSIAIQSKIATSVVAALSDKLAQAAGTVVVGGTANPQAQLLFLKAIGRFSSESSEASFQQILALLDAAIALDPAYAEAWAYKGVVKRQIRIYAKSASEQTGLLAEALAANRKAVALAPTSGLARVLLARAFTDALELRRSLAEIERAIELAPDNGSVLNGAALALRLLDPDRAVGLASRAVALDPLNPFFLAVQANVLMTSRQYEQAAEVARQALALSANQQGGTPYFMALLATGKVEMARANLDKVNSPTQRLAATSVTEWQAGNRAASNAALAALRLQDTESINGQLAAVHAQRGETGAALDALETALKRKETYLEFIASERWFDPIRREPRYKAVQDAVIPPDLWVPPKRAPA